MHVKHWTFGESEITEFGWNAEHGGQVRNTSMNREAGVRHVNTMYIELRAHEYQVMVSSVGESEVFYEQESPEMTEALLFKIIIPQAEGPQESPDEK